MEGNINVFIMQFLLYGLIGTFSATLDALIFKLLLYRTSINFLVINIISTNVGILVSFILNLNLNFKMKTHIVMRFISFYLVGTMGLILSSTIIYLGKQFNLDVLKVKLLSIVIAVGFQFLLNKFVSFRSKSLVR